MWPRLHRQANNPPTAQQPHQQQHQQCYSSRVSMSTLTDELKKRFVSLNGDEKIEFLRWGADCNNADLKQDIFANLKFASRFNLTALKYVGSCSCGHPSETHWFLQNDFKECKNCECSAFYEG